ncbi:Hypothetical predicted protein [Octopus vulgaris]|uniref:Uncharacterized protein n=1 Tax=Octopus vulgaris TaxID=6645 RepID=A0AA36FCR7_OCTVU|nr:Hypothetical predicted protein [Octopus vulgaris]
MEWRSGKEWRSTVFRNAVDRCTESCDIDATGHELLMELRIYLNDVSPESRKALQGCDVKMWLSCVHRCNVDGVGCCADGEAICAADGNDAAICSGCVCGGNICNGCGSCDGCSVNCGAYSSVRLSIHVQHSLDVRYALQTRNSICNVPRTTA